MGRKGGFAGAPHQAVFHTVVNAAVIPGVPVRIGEKSYGTAFVTGTGKQIADSPEGDGNGHFPGWLCKGVGSVAIGSDRYGLAVGVGDGDLICNKACLGRGGNDNFVTFLRLLLADGDGAVRRLLYAGG
jgi:hypothetical protein